MAQRRQTTPTDPLWSITGDPAEIREAARRVWDAWQQYIAEGGRDDGRFEPLRKVFAQNDEDVLRAANEIKWKELGPGRGQVMWDLRRAMSPPDWYERKQARESGDG